MNDINESYKRIEVDYEILHPEYDPTTTLSNDVMLVKLKEDSVYTLVRLDDASSSTFTDDRTDLTAIGCGLWNYQFWGLLF